MISQLDSLIGTSHIPDDDEVLQVKNLLPERERELEEIDEEISRILKIFQERREQIQNKVTLYRQFISPSRRIPDDILGEIFLSCIPECGGAILSTNEPPMLLTRVCRKWRETALSTPMLWASIYIPVPPLSGHQYPDYYNKLADATVTKRVEMIQLWCQRAQECPLSITLYETSATDSEYGRRLFSAILPFSRRWKFLNIRASTAQAQRVVHLSPSQVPWLEALEISIYPDAATEQFLQKSALFSSPTLRRLTLQGVTESIRASPIQWSELTHISITEPFSSAHFRHNANDVAWLLRVCTRIVSFCFVLTNPWDVHVPPIEPPTCPCSANEPFVIPLPFLQRLKLESSTSDEQWIALNLEVPVLQHVRYFVPYPSSTGRPSLLHRWLQTTTAGLQSLETDIGLFAHDDLLECLRLCPNLTSIVLRHGIASTDYMLGAVWVVDADFLRLFYMPDEAGQVLCPQLDEFECSSSSYSCGEPSDAGILEFIRGKQDRTSTPSQTGIKKLSSLRFYIARLQTIPLAEHVNPYVDAGLTLQITFYPNFSSGTDPDFVGFEEKLSPSYPRAEPWTMEASRSYFRDTLPGKS